MSGASKSRSSFDPTERILASRRSVLLTAAGLAAWAGSRSALANVSVDADGENKNVLVFLFLRGGADGLNMVTPYGEEDYYRSRPSLGLARPNDTRVAAKSRLVDLNGFFGLHPALAPFNPIYQSGQMAIIHACGSDDQTRSHFEAMSTVERGAARDHSGPSSGWLARYLMAKAGNDSPLRAVSFSDTMPDSLRGATQGIAMQSLDEFSLAGGTRFEESLARLYEGKDLVAHAGQQTLAVLKSLHALDPKSYKPSFGAEYPKSDLGAALRQVACLVRADMGLEVACLDKGGWDTHVTQGADTGWQAGLLTDVAASLAAFHQDMGPEMNRVTVVMMSEFGRRVAENAGLGTDHGRAGPMFLMGGDLRGGKVHGPWPGLAPSQLDEVGDLRVATDYRQVLTEVLHRRLSLSDSSTVFPSYASGPVGLFT